MHIPIRLFRVYDTIFPVVFGLGLVLLIVHNLTLLSGLFIPSLGLALTLASLPYLFVRTYHTKIKINLLETILVSILLIIISISILQNHTKLQFLNSDVLIEESSYILSAVAYIILMGSSYIIGKKYPQTIGKVFAIMAILAAISTIWIAFSTGLKNGGWVNLENYDAVIPLLIMGTLLSPQRWQWWMSGVTLAGIFFTGAETGLLVITAVAITIIIRQDFSKKLLLPISTLIICLVIATPLNTTHGLWIHNGIQGTLWERKEAMIKVLNGTGNITELDHLVTGNRFKGNWQIRPVTITGYGLEINKLTEETPHNQFLILTDQIGIIAALIWIVATFIWARRTKNWYLFIAIMTIGMADHFLWTFGHFWWYAIIGIKGQGLIFKQK